MKMPARALVPRTLAATEFKELGDAAMQAGNHRDAYRAYTSALEAPLACVKRAREQEEQAFASDEGLFTAARSIKQTELELLERSILSNRSMAYSCAARFHDAAADAITLTRRWPSWSKGYYRLARASEGLGNNRAAAHEYATAFRIMDANDMRGKEDCARALWRVCARLTRPQLAEEVLTLVGMKRASGQQGALLSLTAPSAPVSPAPTASLPAPHEDQRQMQVKDDQGQQQEETELRQLQEEMGAQEAGGGSVSEAELAEAGFQLVSERLSAAGTGTSFFLHTFVGWLKQGGVAADERAALRAMLYLCLRRPSSAAHAAGHAVMLRGRGLAAAPSAATGSTLDQLAHAFSLHGRALLLSSTAISGQQGNSSENSSGGSLLAQHAHATVADKQAYCAALRSLFCAHQLCPTSASYSAALTAEDMLLLGGDALKAAEAAAGECLTRLSKGDAAAADVAVPRRSSALPGEGESYSASEAGTHSGSSTGHTTAAFEVRVRLNSRTLPAQLRTLLVQQVNRLALPALQAVFQQQDSSTQNTHDVSIPQISSSSSSTQSTMQLSQPPTPQICSRPTVAITRITPGRCPGDQVCVTFTVTATILQGTPLQDKAPTSFSLGTALVDEGHIVMQNGLGSCTEVLALTGGVPPSVEMSVQHSSKAEQQQQHSSDNKQLAAPAPMQIVPLQQRQPALELPYADYRLVDALGRECERPQKHPFALSRVYYGPQDLPAGEKQIWYEPADGGCRWRQTASEVIVIATSVPPGTHARELDVSIHTHSLEVKARGSGKVLLSGQLEHGVVPHESVWDCGGGIGEDGCIIELSKMNLELYTEPWRHAGTVWPRLFTHHVEVAWDDTHKDYSDLPPQIKEMHAAQEAKKQISSQQEASEQRRLTASEEREAAEEE